MQYLESLLLQQEGIQEDDMCDLSVKRKEAEPREAELREAEGCLSYSCAFPSQEELGGIQAPHN